MNRRKFLAFLGLAPFAPALTKIAPVEPEVIFTPFKQREIYIGKGIVELLLEQQERTKKVMIDNLKHSYWEKNNAASMDG